jgi:SAM-dependent methyltransferase
MSEVWDDVARWWVDAVRDDPANSTDFHALLAELLPADDHGGGLTLDVGCGEGQAMRVWSGAIIGTDVSMSLLRRARSAGPVLCSRLPDLGWARSEAFDRGICVGVLDLVADHQALFRELHRVVRPHGHLIAVTNHPVSTAPNAEPLVDPNGEILWRWGTYLRLGRIEQEVADRSVVLHHRPLGDLVTAAADAGWRLEQLIEHGPSTATRARHPEYFGQEHVPVLLGIRWARA